MRQIRKDAEPKSLCEVRTDKLTNLATVESARNAFNQNDKGALRARLLAEQGHLCAFCMRRIWDDPDTRVAHLVPVKHAPNLALTWTNLLASCKGTFGPVSTCDVAQENTRLSLDPTQALSIAKLKYETRTGHDGALFITSDDEAARADIETLGLNVGDLPSLRFKEWQSFLSLFKKEGVNDHGKPAWRSFLPKWRDRSHPALPPMLGVVEWKLR